MLLAVLGTGIASSISSSVAQMIERDITNNAVQQAIQSARDQNQQHSGSQPKNAKTVRPADTKQALAPKKERKEDIKPPTNGQQQAARNPSGVPPADERRFVPDEVVVEVASALSSQQTDALTRRFRLANLEAVDFQLGGTKLLRLRIPDRRSVPVVVRALETDNSVLFAQPNYLFALMEENAPDPLATGGDESQYELMKMHLPEAHRLAHGSKVLVAVIDSGIDVSHPDLAGDIAETFDAILVGEPVHKHGTAIAGSIAAHGRLMGVAPAAQILAIRAFSGNGRPEDGTTFAIMKGLDWAAVHGARAINMSFAGPQDPGIARGIAAAHGKGVVLVAAAGNKGANSPPLFPAADRNVIAVTSTDKNDQIPAFANRGRYVAVAAPGVDLILLAPNDSLQRMSGTSFSAAYVTGTVALMLERKPGLTPDGVRDALMASARHLGSTPVDDQSGGGLVDAYQAILTVAPAEASETTVTPAANRQ
ncbi:S8 family peptidase [Bradyrhizobium lablabi]|uniref:S8 family peptidase n=1 Tax=Bradyrhizobium lablabi TaxID=722472 RepID=UPI0015616DF8|nr:S8 family serine peptidase [Bradyrhizobium lablabi]